MTSLRGLSTNIPHERLASSSQPPSPIEEDISKLAWDDEDTKTLVHSTHKGKGKERAVNDADDDDTETLTGDSIKEPPNYPPMTEEDLESRKIEENLKRWDTLEKQRRKMARESRSGSSATNLSEPFVSGGLPNQSFMNRDKKTLTTKDGQYPHQMLQDSDTLTPHTQDTALLQSSPNSPDRTPRNSVFQTDNPFENPDYAISGMISLNTPPRTPDLAGPKDEGRKRSSKGKRNRMEPPRPLDLPTPITPLDVDQRRLQLEMERVKRRDRWWTEWLCGCREDGEEQAGRTNPME